MPSPNTAFTEMVTTTLRDHSPQLSDNMSTHNALIRFLKDKGKIQSVSGGYEIVRPLEYTENSTHQRLTLAA